MTVLEWTKTCCYVALKLNICIRWQVCVFIYTDNVFAKLHGNWSSVLHIKMDIPMFYACAKQYTSHKIIFILFWICKHLLSAPLWNIWRFCDTCRMASAIFTNNTRKLQM